MNLPLLLSKLRKDIINGKIKDIDGEELLDEDIDSLSRFLMRAIRRTESNI